MKLDEKTINKEKEALIIRKYQQYLKLEKALSANTLDAYLTDLDKLLRFLKAENIAVEYGSNSVGLLDVSSTNTIG